MSAVVLVTGATGFVGGALLPRLVAAGYEVHALARSASRRAALAHLDVVWHAGDLERPTSVHGAASAVAARAGRGAALLVHSAAVISYRTADRARQWSVNVEGTRTLLGAARRFSFARAVHVSSVVAVGHAPAGLALDEEALYNGAELGVDYVDTKRAAEELALDFSSDLHVSVVNPGAIFGASTSANTTRFLASIARGQAGPLAPPGGLSVVGVDDVADGIVRALQRGANARRYLLTESHLSALELFRRGASALGVQPARGAVPRRAWAAVVAGARLVDRIRPLELATPQALRLLGVDFRFDAARAREELGWAPRPFSQVLAVAARQARVAHSP